IMSSASPPSLTSIDSDDSSTWRDNDLDLVANLAFDHYDLGSQDSYPSDSDESSENIDRRSTTFDSEADAQQDWDPDSDLQSADSEAEADSGSESDSSGNSHSSMSDDIALQDPLFNDPFSPDLADELELALLAEIDAEMDQLRQMRESRQPQAGSRGRNVRQSSGGAPTGGNDVLVDLELYFRQDRSERRPQNQGGGPADVIDLTNEPDSPVQTHAPRPTVNPRRQNSQARNPPSFSRSDSSILAGGAPVIDLTDDSPEVPRRRTHVPPPPPPPQPRDRRSGGSFMYSSPASAFGGLAAGIRRHLYPFRLFPAPDDEVQLLGILQNRINNATDLNHPLGNIQLQYEHGAFDQRAESPKPVHQAPPPAKSGFTRDTGDDVVVICPACNEELAYDPDVPVQGNHPTRKGKRQRSEHHFWALKGCGHVYCEDCFENRKPTAKRQNSGFRRDPDSKVMCAVDGCETQAANKTAWVGIYL
ncbi:E3 ubiquitin-protein ligase complex slx8-rfp subunit rfp1, partial [Colletotrichum chlorophyti]